MPVDRMPMGDGDIVDFGEFRLKRKGSRYKDPDCPHKLMTIDPDAGTLECQDCGKSIDPFTRLVAMAENRNLIQLRQKREADRIVEVWRKIRRYKPHLRAAKALEQIWRGGKLSPNCPHCNAALLPEDCADGLSSRSTEIERKRRQARDRDREK